MEKVTLALIQQLYQRLIQSEKKLFPAPNSKWSLTEEHGVYIIYSPKDKVVYVGRTVTAKGGLMQRIGNHRRNVSSFCRNHLIPKGLKINEEYSYQYITEPDIKIRTYLEAHTIGHLIPEYVGTGERKNQP